MSVPAASGSPAVPLSILDLSPIPSGSTPAQALRNTVDLARRAEADGVGSVHEQGAADRHLALQLAGDQLVPPGRRFPRDPLGRVAGTIVAQVEQFTAGPGPA